ncbi:TPA_asm: maturation protein [ssRNA phage SRR6960509_7]|uniref:Maturation protein n=1 Tax=ssRNA phage SRR6960509_7 TaxID=2786534 RepID=A0A8S5L4V3_9VIRU|nr:maturation protein [ssRNA phage SRR6960509_7]DAD52571.1 TPA_asm: maturation protein [ssRNA phage SRR6960509_7]
MTTRSYTKGTATTELQESGSAIGADGKYETFQGKQRLKWNNYETTKWSVRRTKGVSPVYGDIWRASICFPGSSFPTANDLLTLQSRLSEKVKGHNFNLAVSAAQGKQTVDMVRNAVFSIGGAITDLKKGKFASAARRFGVAQRPSKLSEKDISGRWLELQYGWLPLISDVYEAAKAFESLTSDARVNTVTESIQKQWRGNASCEPVNYSCYGNVQENARYIYEMTETLSVPRSLGLTDPLSVAWELIPYSFVVDWFVPIGDYLANLNVIPKLQGRFLLVHTRRFSGSSIEINAKPYKYTVRPTSSCKYIYMKRTVSASLTVPKPVFNSIPDAMSPSRIYNAIALVTQRLR